MGSPLAGLVSAAEHGGQSRDYVTRMLAARSFLRAMHDWNPLGLVFTAALALTIIGWAVTRDRRLGLVLVWFFTLAVPLTLFAGVLDPNDIKLRAWLQRYWFAVMPALLAYGFGSLILMFRMLPAQWVSRWRLKTVAVPILAVVLGGTYTVAAVRAVPDLPRDKAWNEFRGYLADHRDITLICADRRLAQTLTFYTRDMWGDPIWRGEIRDWPHYMPQVPRDAMKGPMLYTRWRGMESQIAGGWRPSPPRAGRSCGARPTASCNCGTRRRCRPRTSADQRVQATQSPLMVRRLSATCQPGGAPFGQDAVAGTSFGHASTTMSTSCGGGVQRASKTLPSLHHAQ